MADNITIKDANGVDRVIAADELAGAVFAQRLKSVWGVDGVAVDTSKTNPLPVDQRGRPTYVVSTGNQANVAAARTTHFDIFNASGSGKIITVMGIFIIPTLTAVTGIGLTWEIIRTSAAGSGGTSPTIVRMDNTDPTVPAQVTAHGKPTSGATTADTLFYPNTSSEETSPYATSASVLNHIPALLGKISGVQLNEGDGLKVDQTLSSNVGSTNILCVAVFE